MSELTTEDHSTGEVHRTQAPCKRCGEVIETDVPACPHCGNYPVAALKRGSIAAILVGTILAMPVTHTAVLYWFGSLIGVGLFCCGVVAYWIVVERYSPTKYDARTQTLYASADRLNF